MGRNAPCVVPSVAFTVPVLLCRGMDRGDSCWGCFLGIGVGICFWSLEGWAGHCKGSLPQVLVEECETAPALGSPVLLCLYPSVDRGMVEVGKDL